MGIAAVVFFVYYTVALHWEDISVGIRGEQSPDHTCCEQSQTTSTHQHRGSMLSAVTIKSTGKGACLTDIKSDFLLDTHSIVLST